MKNELDDLLNSVFGKSRTLGPQTLHTDAVPNLTLGGEPAKKAVVSTPKPAVKSPKKTILQILSTLTRYNRQCLK
ncbi:MAG: hypothetical protein RR709_04285 [Ruthenibacterium sp.]